MRRIWFILGSLLCCFSLQGDDPPELEEAQSLVKQLPPEQWEQEVQTIDQVVEKLTDLRNKELAKAARAQDQGDRLQFKRDYLIDARRYWNQADESRDIARRYQEEIDKLEKRKIEILSEHGYADPPSS